MRKCEAQGVHWKLVWKQVICRRVDLLLCSCRNEHNSKWSKKLQFILYLVLNKDASINEQFNECKKILHVKYNRVFRLNNTSRSTLSILLRNMLKRGKGISIA